MGGPAKSDKQFERDIAYKNSAQGDELIAMGKEEMARRRELQAPAIDFYKKIISGDKNALTSATAIPVGQITTAAQKQRENIFNQIPAGAGRDVALLQSDMNKSTSIAQFLNDSFMKAFPGLAAMGTESGQMGLQQTGGGLNAFSGASNAMGQVMQADAQAKAATMGMFGSLAGAAGMAYGGRK